MTGDPTRRPTILAWALGLAAVLGVLPTAAADGPPPLAMAGFLRSHSTFQIGPPAGREWSFKLTMLIPEGTRVAKGEPVARFDGENSLKMEQDARNKLLQAQLDARTAGQSLDDEIDAQVENIATQKSELVLLEADQVDEQKVGPNMSWLISARDKLTADLDITSRKLRLTLEVQRLVRKRQLQATSEKSLATRVEMYQNILAQHEQEKAEALVMAPAGGVVTYLRTVRRDKPRAGGTVTRGARILAIVDDLHLYVECYLKEEDYGALKAGDTVDVRVLGSREVTVPGRVAKITPVVMKVQDFEKGLSETHALFDQRAFRVDVELDSLPPEAKPEGEVEVLMVRHAT